MSDRQRVVITGLGVLCPVGIGHETVWENLLAGRSGIARLTQFDPSPFPVQFGGEVKGFDPAVLGSPRDVRRMDRCTQFALAASRQAVDDAGLDLTALDPEAVGITIGSAAGGFQTLLEQHQVFLERGPRRVSPFFIQHML
ncbi:MAG: beta-ketoacyl synthase N-terminal-like domain-containing protein, partial [Chloroflexota bacterium]